MTTSTEDKSNRIAVALAAAIMMVTPLTFGYYLIYAGFGELSVPPIFLLLGGSFIAIGGSAVLAWSVYKLGTRLTRNK
ncbi:hypothetical protein [Pseudomonas cannabina]|uniref:hypothetical protein n=1 Tax=Pseudomonas cannabina TaxID=86840 RepID=UPI0011C46FC3|nr:hypothetical protein [Pseudomonas cannabina]